MPRSAGTPRSPATQSATARRTVSDNSDTMRRIFLTLNHSPPGVSQQAASPPCRAAPAGAMDSGRANAPKLLEKLFCLTREKPLVCNTDLFMHGLLSSTEEEWELTGRALLWRATPPWSSASSPVV